MTPLKVEARLLLLPTVKVLPSRFTVPAPLSEPIVWLAPRLKLAPGETATVASVPRAVALLEFSAPPVTLTVVPFTKLLAGDVRVVGPVMVIVRAVPPSLSAAEIQRHGGRRAESGVAGKRGAPRVRLVPVPAVVTESVWPPMLSEPRVAGSFSTSMAALTVVTTLLL